MTKGFRRRLRSIDAATESYHRIIAKVKAEVKAGSQVRQRGKLFGRYFRGYGPSCEDLRTLKMEEADGSKQTAKS